MKNISLFVCCICIIVAPRSLFSQTQQTSTGTPQTVTASNAVYFEFLGNGLGFSFNYERRLADNFSLRGGLGDFSVTSEGSSVSVITVPVLANYLLNMGSSNIQMGIGMTLFSGSASNISLGSTTTGNGSGVFLTASIGYRYQPKDGGVLFEIAFTPLIALGYGTIPYVGIGLGYAF